MPYMGDILFFTDNKQAALELRERVASVLDRLGLGRNLKNSRLEPIQISEHLELEIDTNTSTFRAQTSKLHAISTLSYTMLQRSTRDACWLPVRQLAALAGKHITCTSPS
jgi:hypothetical protein